MFYFVYIGVSVSQAISNRGRRYSTAKAFLRPVMHRKNLHVATGAHVTKVRKTVVSC